MSTPHLTPPTHRTRHPKAKGKTKTPSTPPPPIEEFSYTCTCGHPDRSNTWICCDNPDCPVQWYHWECVGITRKALPKEWFCSLCQQSSPTTPTTTPEKEVPLGRTRSGRKKGIAVKKATPKKKGKSKWFDWVEVDSEDEDKDKDEEGNDKVDEDPEKAAVRAKLKESMVRAEKLGSRVKKPQTPLEGQNPNLIEADKQHGKPETQTLSHGESQGNDTEPSSKASNNNDNSNGKDLELTPKDDASYLGPPMRARISGKAFRGHGILSHGLLSHGLQRP